MFLDGRVYEMPFETEDSFRIKLEPGEIVQEFSMSNKDEWIPDELWIDD
jgi:hypothetical protein